jgi:hypothetical protein
MPAVGDEIQCIVKHSGNIYGLVTTDSSGGFATSSDDRRAQFWAVSDTNELACVGTRELQGASLALDTCQDVLVSAQLDGAISLVPRDSSKPISMLRAPDCHSAVTSIAVLHGVMAKRLVSVDELVSVHLDFDTQQLMVSGTMDGQIMLWEISNETPPLAPTQTIKDAHTDAIRALLWVEVDGVMKVISSSFDGHITVWTHSNNTGTLEETTRKRLVDLACGECARQGTAHQGAVTTLALVGGKTSLHPMNSKVVIASGSEDGAVKLWDVASGALVSTVMNCNMGVCSLAWLTKPTLSGAPSVDWLACGLGDNSIVVVDPKTGELIATVRGHDGPVHGLLWLESKGILISCASDATVRTWRVHSENSEYNVG